MKRRWFKIYEDIEFDVELEQTVLAQTHLEKATTVILESVALRRR